MKLNEIQKELKVPKNHRNTFGNYNYRNAEDILEAVKPLLGDSILTLTDAVVHIDNRYYVRATATFLERLPPNAEGLDYERLTVTAYAREEETKKGMDGAQITGAASSYARKYALCGLFLIDDGKDADSDEPSKSHQPIFVGNDLKAPRQLTPQQKKKIASLVQQLGYQGKETTPEDVKFLTGWELIPEKYDDIVFALEEQIEALK